MTVPSAMMRGSSGVPKGRIRPPLFLRMQGLEQVETCFRVHPRDECRGRRHPLGMPWKDDFVLDFVGQRIDAFLGNSGRAVLRALAERQLAPVTPDPGPEMRRLKARLQELTKKIDAVIDLAANSAEHRELMKDRLGRLLGERQGIEDRLRELDRTPARGPNPGAFVDAILASLRDARQLFEHGTMEERKRVIRAFVENLTVDGVSGSGALRAKRIPDAIPLRSTGDSFNMVAGAGFEPATFGL